ncbi:MAG: hypothetical protein QG585_25 [Patescibacteria group bacterium]|nr:hypothetical protein [Patescibacteria group bacterium]
MQTIKKHSKKILVSLALISAFSFFLLSSTNKAPVENEIKKVEILKIRSEKTDFLPGTKSEHLIQEIDAVVLDGTDKGKIIFLINDFTPLKPTDKVFVASYNNETEEVYGVIEKDRTKALIFFVFLFCAGVVALSGKQGVRSLLSLLGSFIVIIYILLPNLLAGAPPVSISIAVASLILFFAIFFTHGFNKESAVAFSGTFIAILITGILANFSIEIAELSGFSSHESVYLNFLNDSVLDIKGIFLAGIIIGSLGILDDIAITQASVVSELWRANKDLSKLEVWKSALKVGREHSSALVNTLALAYTGASLPLLLLFSGSSAPIEMTLSREVFAGEIIRTAIGSLGLLLTVPVTTLLAVLYLKNSKGGASSHAHHHHHG